MELKKNGDIYLGYSLFFDGRFRNRREYNFPFVIGIVDVAASISDYETAYLIGTCKV